MSTRTTRKRKVPARPTAIIEISDSDENETASRTISPPASPKRAKITRTVNEKAKGKQATSASRQRWPRKENNNIAATFNIDRGSNTTFTFSNHPWTVPELLAEKQNINDITAKNIVNLFENENTIPFICRYRRDLIGDLMPDQLRTIKNSYTDILNIRKKAENIISQLKKQNIDKEVQGEVMCAKTTEELEFLYAPYKPTKKGTLYERAKNLGLDVYAERILHGTAPPVRLDSVVDVTNKDLDTEEKVLLGFYNVLSHIFSKHSAILEKLRILGNAAPIYLKSTKINSKSNKEEEKRISSSQSFANKKDDISKFDLYFDFRCSIRSLQPHQILAINRGENLKFLRVSVDIPASIKCSIRSFVRDLFMNGGIRYALRTQVFEKAFEECYTKKLEPLMVRQIRADLNDYAKIASIDVFSTNVKHLLLMSPLKGECILGIDPGYLNGCKLAAISEAADVLETAIIYPHVRNNDGEECSNILAKMLTRNKCTVIALGNGMACRETEFWLCKLFNLGLLDAKTVRYSIVSEQGASIYSCSEVAKREFPNLNHKYIGAVSIARRLNDPLSEYVKIEPQHIGVGMYQHDINERTLLASLNEVVSECVSYIGVDINTASSSLLQHVAGLSKKKVENIIEHRTKCGPFYSRMDLLKVKSIGERTFAQCAGFIRIEPGSISDDSVINPLDCTWVHPESYKIAEEIIQRCNLHLCDIGKPSFIDAIKTFSSEIDMRALSRDLNIAEERLEIVLIGLQRTLLQDYRLDFNWRPLFKLGITRIKDLMEGSFVTGAVTNCTHFGAFVDIGVECDGLIHKSHMKGTTLNISDRVKVRIVNVEIKRRRIGLSLEEIIN